MALELVKCPHCGYKFRMDLKARVNDGGGIAVRGILNSLKPKPRRVETIDIDCPNCNKTFEQRVE